jgi:ribonuclease PH
MEVKRSGGRTNNQLRAVTSELGLLNKPDGSAKYTAGSRIALKFTKSQN